MSTLTLRLEAYAKDAQKLITAAQALADERQHLEVEPLHLLYRLVERDALVQSALDRAGVPAADALVETESQLRRIPKLPDAVAYLSPRMLDLLGRAEGEAARAGGRPVAVSDLFIATTQESTGPVAAVLRAVGLSAPILRATLAGGQVAEDGARGKFGLGPRTGESNGGAGKKGATPVGAAALAQYGTDLTEQAQAGAFDPTVGRDDVLRRMLDVLARRRDHNPLLVGEAGIGKTAIVQELARRMATGDVPTMLKGKRLVALEMGTLVAGAKLRGELEERVRAVLDAARGASGEVILYLPDLSSLAGERGAGELVANALAQGSLKAIAAATPDAVRKSLEESSLARRFVAITVDPPTVEETVAILRGLVAKFEAAHGVRISDPALVAAASFAKRYVPGSALPRSAIDLIDEAAARVRVQLEGVPAELDRLERRLESLSLQLASLADDTDVASNEARARLEKERDAVAPKAKALRERWTVEKNGATGEAARLRAELEVERAKAAAEKDEAKASSLRFGTIPLLEKQLTAAENAAAAGSAGAPLVSNVVAEHDVADVISVWTGVPVARMLEDETEKLLKMEERLGARVVGQDAAVRAVSKAVRRGRVGLRDPRKPIGSFLFLGPTGVGKTELAKALAELLFDDEAALTRLDMSEFMEKHTVARLIGSPPGYVDSDEGGFLTEAVRRKPYSVVLFDELEKAHPDVFNVLLQVLDDGRLTDSRGRLAQFADTVIIMTSNVGGAAILEHDGDAESLREKTTTALRGHFRPEFLNRIDDVVIFDRLTKENLRGIAEIQLKGLGRLLGEKRLALVVTDAAKDRLTELGYEPAFGARPLKRVILKNLQDPLAEEILRGGYVAGDTILVDVDAEGGITFAKKPG